MKNMGRYVKSNQNEGYRDEKIMGNLRYGIVF